MRQPATTGRRKRGTRNRNTKQKIEASGLTPLDSMLAVMRDPKAKAAVRLEAAKSAAPYLHPQLAPIDIEVMRLIGRPAR